MVLGFVHFFIVSKMNYYASLYIYNCSYLITKPLCSDFEDIGKRVEMYYKTIWLKDSYIAAIFFTELNNGKSLKLDIYKITQITYREDIEKYDINIINFNTDVSMSDFFKLNEKKLCFISTEGTKNDSTRKLHILLFHFYDNYTKMKMRSYSFDINNYIFIKELSGYFYNNYLVFATTSILKKETMDSDDLINYFSVFMIFGYPNGTNNIKDISYLFSDYENFNPNINFVSFLYEDCVIDNNIFGYIPDDKIIFISNPNEILLFKENEEESLIENNSTLYSNETYRLKQNKDLTKTSKLYYFEYQYIIREPDYDDLYANAHDTITFTSDIDYDFKSEYVPQRFYGKINKLKFKLCYYFCETCNEIGISDIDHKCLSYLPLYQYDYWFYNDKGENNQLHCVPEGYYYDKEEDNIFLCNSTAYKYYFNVTDNRIICFKEAYECPETYPFLNITSNECIKPQTPPTTIMIKMQTTVINPVPMTYINQFNQVPSTTKENIPTSEKKQENEASNINEISNNIENSYISSKKWEYNFVNLTKEGIYESLKNTIFTNFPKKGESITIPTDNNYIFEVTTINNQLNVLKGEKKATIQL